MRAPKRALARSQRYTPQVARTATVGIALTAALLASLTGPGPAAAGPGDKKARPKASPAETLGAAFRAYDGGDLEAARRAVRALDDGALLNRDYALFIRGQVALLAGDAGAATTAFTALASIKGSRFARKVPWRLADARWAGGDRAGAAAAYRTLLASPGADDHADLGAVKLRLAEVAAARGKAAGVAAYRELLLDHPGHPLAEPAAAAARALGGDDAVAFSPTERLDRAKRLTAAHLWDQAVAELALIPAAVPVELGRRRDYWLGTTLFKMRRRYGEAGTLLLGVYPHLGDNAAEAMFHGARALSRADRDDEAITWYRKVIATYPSTVYAQEAAYLAGWLELNRGRYAEAIPGLEDSLRRYPRSKWAPDALWFLGLAHYLLGHWKEAEAAFEELGRRDKSLEGGKGQYWLARTRQRAGRQDEALTTYRGIVGRWPFSWYALLARARLKEAGVDVGPFGDSTRKGTGPALATRIGSKAEGDLAVRRADELIAAGLGVEAGDELERSEKSVLGRLPRDQGLAVLLDRYRRAGNFNRPWMLAVVHADDALRSPADGNARVWWEHAYPRAYRELIEQHQGLGKNPAGYLYSIMRKESGFDPHVLSYADAQGLLQMIPATTIRVAKILGLPYDPGRLYEPEFNVQTASWYIGNLLAKFGGQIPVGAGSFNSGPRPVMRWLDQNGDRPIDEFVELVSYVQTREYMKKVTENFARYTYLYGGTVYDQPLVVDKAYRVDDVTY